jgi:predicted nucleic acid-binding protein
MRYLLDVNALIAAIWKNHPDHSTTDRWLAGKEIATCPISELGFLRVSTHSKALNADMTTARRLLEAFLDNRGPQFVADDLPPLKLSAQKSVQVTDQYLAELAASKGMKLATLDEGISHRAVELIL